VKNWTASTLGETCELYQPKTISTKEMVADGAYPVFGANGIIGRYDKFNHEEPQLLVTCRGATCGSVNVSLPKSWITGNAMVVRPKQSDLSLGFLGYFFRGVCDFSKVITGSAQPQITRQTFSPVKIKIPPLPEQRRIVALLDEAFEGLAIAIANTEKNLKNAREVFEIYLNSVFTEKGEGWAENRLGDVSDLISGQHIEASDYNFENRGIAYLTGPSDFGELHPVISKWTEKPKRTALQNDILITVKGSGVGKINLLDFEEVAISRQLMAVRTKGISTKLLYWFLSLKFEHFQSLANGAAIPGISRHDVLDLKLSFPLGEKQFELVAEIENISSLVVAMESCCNQKLAAIAELKQSLLQKAFAGELTKNFRPEEVLT
jgi:type I restriction enzyme, S subunit